jgi:hypothetical protein
MATDSCGHKRPETKRKTVAAISTTNTTPSRLTSVTRIEPAV